MNNRQLDNLIGLGAGGHARVVIDLVRARGGDVYGLLVESSEQRNDCMGVPVLGTDEKLSSLRGEGFDRGFVGIGATRADTLRQGLFNRLKHHDFDVPPLVHPDAVVATDVDLSAGLQIFAGAVVNADTHLEQGVVINTSAVVEHSAELECFCHIGPGAALAGGVTVGRGSHVGIGATILENIEVGRGVTIGAGSVVLDDVPDNTTVAGVPAQPI